VVRFTNRDIITQIVSSEINGDKIFAAAYSHELRAYGIEHGLTNWAAAYATGLLLARRVLTKLGIDGDFTGVEEADGEYTLTEAAETDDGERRPFKANLDVGLARTSTGARVFGVMKGASDGGILVPHSENRFPGFDVESEELDAETLKKYIFGGHVAEYMETLADDDEERYKSQFSKYIEDDVEADGLEELYGDAHKAIRENPNKKYESDGPRRARPSGSRSPSSTGRSASRTSSARSGSRLALPSFGPSKLVSCLVGRGTGRIVWAHDCFSLGVSLAHSRNRAGAHGGQSTRGSTKKPINFQEPVQMILMPCCV